VKFWGDVVKGKAQAKKRRIGKNKAKSGTEREEARTGAMTCVFSYTSGRRVSKTSRGSRESSIRVS
jgi:hypothetical protein